MVDLAAKYPTDPTEYVRSDHFLEALDEDKRHFYLKDALSAIRNGDIQPADGSAEAEWVLDKHGVKIYVLVGYDDRKEEPILITGWPGIHDPRQAIESGQWREDELRDIHEFNNGNGTLEEAYNYP